MKRLRKAVYAILRGSERYLKTDMVYLAKGGFWLSLGQIISSASALILAIAFANLLPKETYGTYKYILSVVSILGITTLPGITTYLNQAIARGYEGSLMPSLRTRIRFGLVGGGASFLLGAYYYYAGNTDLAISFLIAGFFIPVMDTLSIYHSYLQSKKLFKRSIEYFVASQIVAVGALMATIFLTKNLHAIILAYFISWTTMRLLFFMVAVKKFPPNDNKDAMVMSYGKHLSAVGIIGTIALYFDSLIMFHEFGAVELAIYSLAFAPINQIRGLYKNIPALALPKLAARTFDEIGAILSRRLLMLLAIGALIAIPYALLAPYLFGILFPRYPEAILFSQLLAGVLVLVLPATLLSAAINSKISVVPKPWLYWSIVPNAILILSLFALVPTYGIAGAIASRFIFIIVSFAVSYAQWRLLAKKFKNKGV
ncbi:MAG: hypothetical protein COZ49_01745 [Candidatus Yonathbacteria bacterium CG_4_10_14_3_um_filter_47_65]|uniref:Polysaccharide biosynthesis protein C-terminal domain-containing protein n=1 Tax=Candidatus Nomurabacteria bacterium CG1_02_47_685 TaxID=1805282 RepID=A0A1J4VDK3_9BACT|nr:MAG: hypothetical protein AUJ44_00535 [Candidatus Nomurabacteria bacterium CG1_02_47_685]PIX56501.1 MAG: hypothetical protein COZ49_01745 [Candidatus Yonathbacteria bacterium CG_4_10_14_3_um_filter_47_65]PJC67240.1 MAG: hypothetical protein CO016_02510 [Candidatus Yonathbacteria bacterium CG_4_8_14_3_um_filter_46_25]